MVTLNEYNLYRSVVYTGNPNTVETENSFSSNHKMFTLEVSFFFLKRFSTV